MKTKKILYLFLLPLIFTACETKDIPVYTSDDAALYFQRTASYIWGSTTVTYSNSTEFTFAGAAAEKNNVTYSAEVRTMGNVTDYDRPFKVEIDKEMSTGIQGRAFRYEPRHVKNKSRARVMPMCESPFTVPPIYSTVPLQSFCTL